MDSINVKYIEQLLDTVTDRPTAHVVFNMVLDSELLYSDKLLVKFEATLNRFIALHSSSSEFDTYREQLKELKADLEAFAKVHLSEPVVF
jgi:hypothetical protein